MVKWSVPYELVSDESRLSIALIRLAYWLSDNTKEVYSKMPESFEFGGQGPGKRHVSFRYDPDKEDQAILEVRGDSSTEQRRMEKELEDILADIGSSITRL